MGAGRRVPVPMWDVVRLLHQHVHDGGLPMVQVPNERHIADEGRVARQPRQEPAHRTRHHVRPPQPARPAVHPELQPLVPWRKGGAGTALRRHRDGQAGIGSLCGVVGGGRLPLLHLQLDLPHGLHYGHLQRLRVLLHHQGLRLWPVHLPREGQRAGPQPRHMPTALQETTQAGPDKEQLPATWLAALGASQRRVREGALPPPRWGSTSCPPLTRRHPPCPRPLLQQVTRTQWDRSTLKKAGEDTASGRLAASRHFSLQISKGAMSARAVTAARTCALSFASASNQWPANGDATTRATTNTVEGHYGVKRKPDKKQNLITTLSIRQDNPIGTRAFHNPSFGDFVAYSLRCTLDQDALC